MNQAKAAQVFMSEAAYFRLTDLDSRLQIYLKNTSQKPIFAFKVLR